MQWLYASGACDVSLAYIFCVDGDDGNLATHQTASLRHEKLHSPKTALRQNSVKSRTNLAHASPPNAGFDIGGTNANNYYSGYLLSTL